MSLIFVTEKDLVFPVDNDAWLVRFLRPCKYYPQSAYELVSNIITSNQQASN